MSAFDSTYTALPFFCKGTEEVCVGVWGFICCESSLDIVPFFIEDKWLQASHDAQCYFNVKFGSYRRRSARFVFW